MRTSLVFLALVRGEHCARKMEVKLEKWIIIKDSFYHELKKAAGIGTLANQSSLEANTTPNTKTPDFHPAKLAPAIVNGKKRKMADIDGLKNLIAPSAHVSWTSDNKLSLFGTSTGQSLSDVIDGIISCKNPKISSTEKMFLEILKQLKIPQKRFAKLNLAKIWKKLTIYKKQNNASIQKKIHVLAKNAYKHPL